MKKQPYSTSPAIGASSLLVIIAVLCLTVFALLSLNTALAEKRQSEAAAQAVEDCYAADLQAEQIFSRLRKGETVENVAFDEGIFRYSCPVTENQTLYVELKQDNGSWDVCRWQVVAHSEPRSDTLPVWNGK